MKTSLHAALCIMAISFCLLGAGCSHYFDNPPIQAAPEYVISDGEKDYREYPMPIPEDVSLYTFPAAREHIQKNTTGENGYRASFFEYEPSPSYDLKQPYRGGFVVDGHEFWIVESGQEYVPFSDKGRSRWQPKNGDERPVTTSLYRDGKLSANLTPLFQKPLCYGFDGFEGVINGMQLVNNELAFEYKTGPCSATTTTDIWYGGKSINAMYQLEGSRHPFALGEHLGFVGRSQGKERLYLDGKPITPEFDRVYAQSCCAMHQAIFEVFGENLIYTLGIRNGEYRLIEVRIRMEEVFK